MRILPVLVLSFVFNSDAFSQLTVHYEANYSSSSYSGDVFAATKRTWFKTEDGGYDLFIKGNKSLFKPARSYNLPKAQGNNFDANTRKKKAAAYKQHKPFPYTNYFYFEDSVVYLPVAPITENPLMMRFSMNEMTWHFTENTDIICGFPCRLAYGYRNGQTLKAWYSWELPALFGPFGTVGLPGTVLQVETANMLISATSVSDHFENVDMEMPYKNSISRESYETIMREKRMYRGGLLGKRLDPYETPRVGLAGSSFYPRSRVSSLRFP